METLELITRFPIENHVAYSSLIQEFKSGAESYNWKLDAYLTKAQKANQYVVVQAPILWA